MNNEVKPMVGMKVTVSGWTDQVSGEIVKVSDKRATVRVSSFRGDVEVKFSLRSTGKWKEVGFDKMCGRHLILEAREAYIDPTF